MTVPVGGASTVACPADANVQPTPPPVTDNCGRTVTPVLTGQTPTPVCTGTKTYTFTFTDCNGTALTWVYTYTISPPTFTVPVGGASTVACPADANVQPTPPPVTDNCGRTVTPVLTGQTPTPVCTGTKTYTFTFTDCNGTALTWVYTYTISPPTFTVPVGGASTVACPADANVQPTPPPVTDNCGRTVTPVLTGQTPTPVCTGTKTYTFTFTDCNGTALTWVYTYTISPPTFTVPVGGASTVACPADANVQPTPPPVTDNCGRTVTPVLTGQTPTPVCTGTKTYTFTFTDCNGTALTWVYTYTISPPTFTVPVGGASTVACPADANVQPTPPPVTDNCGRTVTPVLTGQTPTPVCTGTKTYTFTFTDCNGTALTWVYTYTISPPTFTVPVGGASTVACPADANVQPTPPPVTDNCARTVTPVLTGQTPPPVCTGTKTSFFTDTATTEMDPLCVHAALPISPTFTVPVGGASTVACPA